MANQKINQYANTATEINDGSFLDIDENIGTSQNPVYQTAKLEAKIATLPYKQYKVSISQSGTNAPTVDSEIRNTLGGTVVYTRVSAGNYLATLNGAFSTQDRFIAVCNCAKANFNMNIVWANQNQFIILTFDSSGNYVDDVLSYSQIKIEIE